MKQVYFLKSPQIQLNCIKFIEGLQTDSERYLMVEIKEPTRNLEQNALLHSLLTQISNQVTWQGQKYPMHIWKRLCVAAWLKEDGEQAMLIPSLDGKGVEIIYQKTAELNLTQCSSLIEWCFAFGAENNVKFRE